MVWDGDWKHLAPLYYVCMNDGIGFYIWGLGREVWEGEMLFTAIALAFCEVEICRPPRKCTSFVFLIHFFVVLWSFLSCSFFFCPASSSPIMLTLPKIFSSCPLKIIKLSIQCRSISCQHHFPSPVLFVCSSFMINDTEHQWGGAHPKKEKLHLKCTLFKVNMRNAFFPHILFIPFAPVLLLPRIFPESLTLVQPFTRCLDFLPTSNLTEQRCRLECD